jgi:hypothetical protein
VTSPSTGKPTVAELGIDLAAQAWHRSGSGDGAIEVAFARAARAGASTRASTGAGADADADRAEWVLMRVTGDQEQRVLVFDRHEWECFLDGARKGEFDTAAAGQQAAGQQAAGQ